MENKTPMQEAIDRIKANKNVNVSNKARVIKTLTELLEKEKELFVNTFIDGEVNCGRQLAQDYYNEKFNNK
jgi:hypothetical protein